MRVSLTDQALSDNFAAGSSWRRLGLFGLGSVGKLNRALRVAKLPTREKVNGRNLAVLLDSMMLESKTLIDLAMSRDNLSAALDRQVAIVAKWIDELDAYAMDRLRRRPRSRTSTPGSMLFPDS